MPGGPVQHLVDTPPPKVRQVRANPRRFDKTGRTYSEEDWIAFGGPYGKDHPVRYSVSFDDAMTLTPSTGGLQPTVDVAGTEVVLTYSDGANIRTFRQGQNARFAYKVKEGQQDIRGIDIKGISLLVRMTPKDAAGNDTGLSAFDFSQMRWKVKVDAKAPDRSR